MLLAVVMVMVGLLLPQGSHGSTPLPSFKLKAANLGGWLVTEGWILPSLFDGIPSKDLLDGTQIQLTSVTTGKYLSADSGGGSVIVANRASASSWETFRLWRNDQNSFNFKVFSNQFIGLGTVQGVANRGIAVATTPGSTETFRIVRNGTRIKIQASNGFYIQAKSDQILTADYAGDGGWGNSNPSVFNMTVNLVNQLRGEFQVTNGYGPVMAPKVMKDHWNNFIVENDFKFMAQNGINAARIPVGWWIASGPNPPAPFVGGSLDALDRAFSWALTYKINIIVCLHAVPGSQNGYDHSGTRDGTLAWGSNTTIQQSVAIIDFLAARYANNSRLYAVELINEPLAPGVTLNNLTNYYVQGYTAVRKYTQSAYVVLSNRLGPMDPKELFTPQITQGQRIVIDVHYYNLYDDKFNSMTPQQNIDYIYTTRAAQLANITTTDGPLTFVGEWVDEFAVRGATVQDYQNFATAQLQVYGNATFGWAYWTLQNVYQAWNLTWMITNGFIKL